MRKTVILTAAVILVFVCLCGCAKEAPSFAVPDPVIVLPGGDPAAAVIPASLHTPFSLDTLPEYDGSPCAVVNGGVPYFTMNEKVATSYEYYSRLDKDGRCGAAVACIGADLMPVESRDYIGLVRPSGWRSDRYEFIENEYLYNRCHLIGFQLAGENANEKNLITGTRYMNIDGMLPYENLIADYVKNTGNHVLYRVTPVFEGEDVIARGVLMEAYSTEDHGEGVCFCVFSYNVQPDIVINYATGESRPDEGMAELLSGYVINVRSRKFHKLTCKYAILIREENVEFYHGSRDFLIERGYKACGYCRP